MRPQTLSLPALILAALAGQAQQETGGRRARGHRPHLGGQPPTTLSSGGWSVALERQTKQVRHVVQKKGYIPYQ